MIDSGSPRNAPAKAVYGLLALDGTPPPEILRRGREQVRQYGGRVVLGEVVAAEPAAPSADGDLRFTVTLADGRRVLVATGLKDELPQVPGLAEHWGHSVVHCHGWEMRDEPIGILASGMVGTTEVPGVWVAGNATDLVAQVGASAVAGALAGADINSALVTADTDAALQRTAEASPKAAPSR